LNTVNLFLDSVNTLQLCKYAVDGREWLLESRDVLRSSCKLKAADVGSYSPAYDIHSQNGWFDEQAAFSIFI
jgi:hypothetical protein